MLFLIEVFSLQRIEHPVVLVVSSSCGGRRLKRALTNGWTDLSISGKERGRSDLPPCRQDWVRESRDKSALRGFSYLDSSNRSISVFRVVLLCYCLFMFDLNPNTLTHHSLVDPDAVEKAIKENTALIT